MDANGCDVNVNESGSTCDRLSAATWNTNLGYELEKMGEVALGERIYLVGII